MPKDLADRIIMFSVIGLVAWGMIGLPLVHSQQAEPSHQTQPAQSETQNRGTNQTWPEALAKEHGHEGSQKGQWYSTFLEHTPDWFVAIFTALLTFVTWRLVSSTNRLWDAGERQLAQIKASAEMQSADMQASIEVSKLAAGAAAESAKAAVRSADIAVLSQGGNMSLVDMQTAAVTDVGLGHVCIIKPVIKNVGPSAAQNVHLTIQTHRTAMDIQPADIFSGAEAEPENAIGAEIGPGAPIGQTIAITEELVNEMWEKKRRLFIRFLVQYETIFDPNRIIEKQWSFEVQSFSDPKVLKFDGTDPPTFFRFVALQPAK